MEYQAKDSSSISPIDSSTTENYDFQAMLGSAQAWKEKTWVSQNISSWTQTDSPGAVYQMPVMLEP